MSKILDFPTLKEWQENSLGDLDNQTPIVIAYKMPNGEVCTGWWKASLQVRQELISHLQVDVMLGVVRINE